MGKIRRDRAALRAAVDEMVELAGSEEVEQVEFARELMTEAKLQTVKWSILVHLLHTEPVIEEDSKDAAALRAGMRKIWSTQMTSDRQPDTGPPAIEKALGPDAVSRIKSLISPDFEKQYANKSNAGVQPGAKRAAKKGAESTEPPAKRRCKRMPLRPGTVG